LDWKDQRTPQKKNEVIAVGLQACIQTLPNTK